MNCKVCKGTGKILLLYSEVECDCIIKKRKIEKLKLNFDKINWPLTEEFENIRKIKTTTNPCWEIII